VTVVADASLAVKWVYEEADSGQALALRDGWRRAGESVVAPPLFRAEATNIFHKYTRRGEIEHSDALDLLDLLLSFVAIQEPPGLYRRALEMAGMLGLSAAYDAQYLALAEYGGCEMWTADLRLIRSTGSRFPLAHWLGEIRTG
jgi:predicted nucleic acid-binding protein